MRFLKRVAIVLVALIVLFVAAAYLQPRYVTVERSLDIAAAPEVIFPLVNSLESGTEWSPWASLDPDMDITYEGPSEGVGNIMSWTSENPQVGNGRQEITASIENERVETALDFGAMGTARAWFILDATGDGTNVTWGFEADMGNNPMGRWMGIMMDSWVGGDYELGLSNIRDLVEG